MRIRVLSDLHREFGSVTLPDVAADVVVLAGDIDRSIRGVEWARMTFPGVPVLYVAGNHEHYEERIGRLHEKLKEAATGSNVHILENETFELTGYRFFGATLWTDFNLLDDRPTAMFAAGAKETGMNDYRKIRRADTGRLHPKHIALLHADSRLAPHDVSRQRRPRAVDRHHTPRGVHPISARAQARRADQCCLRLEPGGIDRSERPCGVAARAHSPPERVAPLAGNPAAIKTPKRVGTS